MTYELEELSLELIEALVPLMPRIKQRTAAVSARETQHALRQAIAWRHVNARERALAFKSSPLNKE